MAISDIMGLLGRAGETLGGGTSGVYTGLLSEDELRAAKNRASTKALFDLSAAMAEAGRPQAGRPTSTFGALAKGLSAAQEGYQGTLQQQAKEKLAANEMAQKLASQTRAAEAQKLIQSAFQPAQAAQPAPYLAGAPYGKATPAQPAGFNLDAIAPQLMQTAEGRAALGEIMKTQEAMQPKLTTLKPEENLGFYKDGKWVSVASGADKPQLLSGEESNIALGLFGTNDPAKLAKIPNAYSAIRAESLKGKKAGATNVNVNDKSFFSGLASGGGDILKGKQAKADAARGTISTIQQTLPLLEDGVFSGPFAKEEILINRIADKLGLGGKDTAEKLGNTVKAVQNTAKLQLDAATAMKGQGQISDAERALIGKASGGDLEKMTASEVKELMIAMDKVARYQISEYQTMLGKVPNIKDSPWYSLYNVDMPEPLTYPVTVTTPNGVFKFNSQKDADDFKKAAGL